MDKLNAMAIFVRVIERGSFSAVARELQTTQPTISKVLRALETELGGRLISRSTRKLSLTDEGRPVGRAAAGLHPKDAADSCRFGTESSRVRPGQSVYRLHGRCPYPGARVAAP